MEDKSKTKTEPKVTIAKATKKWAYCKGCDQDGGCRNQLHRPENVTKCAVLHGLGGL